MWTRKELKDKAKNSLRRNYLSAALAAIIFMMVMNAGSYYDTLTGGQEENAAMNSVTTLGNLSDSSSIGNFSALMPKRKTLSDEYFSGSEEESLVGETGEGGAAGSQNNGMVAGNDIYDQIAFGDYTYGQLSKMTSEELLDAYTGFVKETFASIQWNKVLPVTGFWFLFTFLISNAIEVGTCSFYLKNSGERAPLSEILKGFKDGNYLRNIVTILIRDIKVLLWAMLFYFPGLVKSLEYRMVPYLMADFPEMTRKEAFKASRYMMRGEKVNAFILDMSFILWMILDMFTGGIAGVLWVNPYQMSTNAELYLKLKEMKGIGTCEL